MMAQESFHLFQNHRIIVIKLNYFSNAGILIAVPHPATDYEYKHRVIFISSQDLTIMAANSIGGSDLDCMKALVNNTLEQCQKSLATICKGFQRQTLKEGKLQFFLDISQNTFDYPQIIIQLRVLLFITLSISKVIYLYL